MDLTLSPKPEGSVFQKYCCINRTCEHYGTHLFRLLPEENSENESVKWKRFDYVASGSDIIWGTAEEDRPCAEGNFAKRTFTVFN